MKVYLVWLDAMDHDELLGILSTYEAAGREALRYPQGTVWIEERTLNFMMGPSRPVLGVAPTIGLVKSV